MNEKICLSMIVKNEAPVIRRCLESVKPWIQSWVVVDTGSTDGTQEIIRQYMQDMPGKLVENPWVNFSHNRNEALDLSRSMADYSLFIDADEIFVPSKSLKEIPTDMDCLFIKIREKRSFHHRQFLLRNQAKVRWTGVLHECLRAEEPQAEEFFNGGEILSYTEDGHRFQNPNKYFHDALVLEDALKQDPENERYVFFLAQSYLNAKEYPSALKNYERRSKMGGNPNEVFFSLFMVGAIQEQLDFPDEVWAKNFFKAHQFRPFRKEPLYGLSIYYMKNNRFQEAYDLLNHCISAKYPEDAIYVQTYILEICLPFNLFECCFYLKKYDQCIDIGQNLLSNPDTHKDIQARINNRFSFIKTQIKCLEINI
jgi:glycosyltransferase involved in cell wall biosynthesis